MLVWSEGAPQFHIDIDEQLTTYNDKIISCHKPVHYPKLFDLVNTIQVHRHSHTYRKEYNKSMYIQFSSASCEANYDSLFLR